MQEKFKWSKFIIDCLICLGIAVMSPVVFFYLVKWLSDLHLKWLLYPIQSFLYPMQWLLYPLHWFFDVDVHAIADIASWFCFLSIISFFIINFFYKIHKLSLFVSFIFMVCYTAFAYYFFSHL